MIAPPRQDYGNLHTVNIVPETVYKKNNTKNTNYHDIFMNLIPTSGLNVLYPTVLPRKLDVAIPIPFLPNIHRTQTPPISPLPQTF